MTYREQDLVASIIDANLTKTQGVIKGELSVIIALTAWKRILNHIDKYKSRSEVLQIEESLCQQQEQPQQQKLPI